MIKTLLVDGRRYNLRTIKDEEREFHPMVKEHYKEIFGEDSFYFEKRKLVSRSGIAGIPDAFVITLSKPYEWYIVENELSTHDVHKHIVSQVSTFVDTIDELETQRDVRDALYNQLDSDDKLLIEKKTGMDSHRFLDNLITEFNYKIALIFDEITPEVEKASKSLRRLANTEIIEFKTFIGDDSPNPHAHLITIPTQTKKEVIAEIPTKKERETPEYYKNWQSLFEWVDENVKEIVKELINEILAFGNITHAPHSKYYHFYKGESTTKNTFVVFLLTKKKLNVRIRTDPRTFRDHTGLVKDKIYKGWFFKQGQEREFQIENLNQIKVAIELIKYSYQISGEQSKKQESIENWY